MALQLDKGGKTKTNRKKTQTDRKRYKKTENRQMNRPEAERELFCTYLFG